MFGYVIVNQKQLSDEDYRIYHSFYCGLCHQLKEMYGTMATRLLSNDMTFLKLVLTGLYEPKIRLTKEGCTMHPIKHHRTRMDVFDIYATQMTIVLAYYKALDDVHDEGKHKRRLKELTPLFEEIKKEYPEKIFIIDSSLKRLTSLEEENCQDLDLMCNTFGKVLGEIFRYQDDMWSEELYILGTNLGKFIYLMDAYDDVEDDIRHHNYNPFIKYYEKEDFDHYVEKILTMFMSEATLAFERMPILEYSEIIRNILYSGVWSRFEAVKQKRNEKEKKNESL